MTTDVTTQALNVFELEQHIRNLENRVGDIQAELSVLYIQRDNDRRAAFIQELTDLCNKHKRKIVAYGGRDEFPELDAEVCASLITTQNVLDNEK